MNVKRDMRVHLDTLSSGFLGAEPVRGVMRVRIQHRKLDLSITISEDGNLKILDSSSSRLAILPLAANVFIVQKVK